MRLLFLLGILTLPTLLLAEAVPAPQTLTSTTSSDSWVATFFFGIFLSWLAALTTLVIHWLGRISWQFLLAPQFLFVFSTLLLWLLLAIFPPGHHEGLAAAIFLAFNAAFAILLGIPQLIAAFSLGPIFWILAFWNILVVPLATFGILSSL